MERLQRQFPNDDFQIVDQYGNPAKIDDYIAVKSKPKSAKAAKDEARKEDVKRRLKRCR